MTPDLPSIFDSKGHFAALPSEVLTALLPERKIVYQRVRDAAEESTAADTEVTASLKAVEAAVKAEAEIANYVAKTFQPRTQFDLWKETVKGIAMPE